MEGTFPHATQVDSGPCAQMPGSLGRPKWGGVTKTLSAPDAEDNGGISKPLPTERRPSRGYPPREWRVDRSKGAAVAGPDVPFFRECVKSVHFWRTSEAPRGQALGATGSTDQAPVGPCPRSPGCEPLRDRSDGSGVTEVGTRFFRECVKEKSGKAHVFGSGGQSSRPIGPKLAASTLERCPPMRAERGSRSPSG